MEGKNCPVFKCMAPDCASFLQETPKDANGCPLCPRCRPIGGVAAAAISVPIKDLTSKPPCPVVDCIPPSCPSWQQQTPTDANGCPLCPTCTGGNWDLTDRFPCPMVRCVPPNCPLSQQETPKTEQGCPLCPKCKGVVGINPVLTAGASLSVQGAALDLTGVVCPLLSCPELNCPLFLQEKTTGANGCPGCPRCRQITAKAGGKLLAGKAKGLTAGLNACAVILCLPNHSCVDGKCVPIDRPSCALINCGPDKKCVNGFCIPINIVAGPALEIGPPPVQIRMP
jgi:hypothetical protein